MNTKPFFTRWTLLLVLAAGLVVSCSEEEPIGEFAFSSKIEGMTDSDTTGSAARGTKVYLENEKWLYWEDGDIISIGSDRSEGSANNYMAQLAHVNAGFIHDPDGDWQQFNGVFITSLPRTSKYFLALHPYDPGNIIRPAAAGSSNFSAVSIVCPATQPFTGNDLSFARNVIPMVAWYGGEWRPTQPSEPFNLDFHSLAAIVRIQFYAQESMTIYGIGIKDLDGNSLSGTFSVQDYNTASPYLVDGGDGTGIMIQCDENTGRTFAPGEIISFYAVIPALGRSTTMRRLALNIQWEPSGEQDIVKTLSIPIRRCGISYPPALEISPDEGGKINDIGLAGNGTELRPYKIYTNRDLLYLRKCFNNPVGGVVKVNGVEVTENTLFHLMRNDLRFFSSDEHADSVWSEGINDFKGKFIWKAYSGAASPGFHNYSNAPLFQSISAQGEVIDLPLGARCSDLSDPEFSPFCHTNNGHITDCRVYTDNFTDAGGSGGTTHKASAYALHGTSSLAGFAVQNNGIISGSSSEATFSTSGPSAAVAGIALHNEGTIKSCAAATPLRIYAASDGAGIAWINSGTIEDSYFTVRQTESNNVSWSGIATENHGTIKRCYMSATAAVVTTRSAAGIVGQNHGTVDYCWFAGSITASETGAGIAHTNLGTIINCYVNGAQLVSPPGNNSVVGGLVAYMGNDLEDNPSLYVLANSFYYGPRILHQNAADLHKVGALIAYAYNGTVDNCYAYETGNPINKFYYENVGTTITNCHHVGYSSYPSEPGIAVPTSTEAPNMYTSLQANKDNHGTGVDWIPGNPPTLQTTRPASKSAHRVPWARR